MRRFLGSSILIASFIACSGGSGSRAAGLTAAEKTLASELGFDAAVVARVRAHGTAINGTNYDIDHDQIVEKYRQWESRLGLDLTGGGGDWLSADIRREPADWLALAREVYAFSPDIVEQGTNDVETLAAELRKQCVLFLWWD